MPMYPSDYRYSTDHEWIGVSGRRGRVGITDFAQKQLGDVVYLELPEVGASLQKGEMFGTIESVKAVSELYAPVSGRVVEVNTALKGRPQGVNEDPHGAWMIVIELADPGELKTLLDSAAYGALVEKS